MVTDRNVSSFIDSLCKDGDAFMEGLRQRAENEGVPIIRRQAEGFIKSLLLIKKPKKILEIGTGVAYSAIFMARTLPEAHIETIENYPPRLVQARENIKAADLCGRINLIEGDAADILPSLCEKYDFIFLDGPKAQYGAFLPEILRILPEGGILLADNVLQGGDIALSRFALERRQRTIHERLRAFLYDVMRCDELETCILPVEDGMSLSIKNKQIPNPDGRRCRKDSMQDKSIWTAT